SSDPRPRSAAGAGGSGGPGSGAPGSGAPGACGSGSGAAGSGGRVLPEVVGRPRPQQLLHAPAGPGAAGHYEDERSARGGRTQAGRVGRVQRTAGSLGG